MFDHCIYFNTTALARRLEREWSAAFAPFGLTPPQAFMLRAILDRPGLMQHELAQALAISRPTATRALDGLEAKGMIARKDSNRDGREQSVHPTPAAGAIRAPLNEAAGQMTRRLKRRLGERAFTDTVASMRAIRSALK
jgi:DNA-binding MarR family transcriptional regulator